MTEEHAGSYDNKSYHMAIYLYISMSCGKCEHYVFLRQV